MTLTAGCCRLPAGVIDLPASPHNRGMSSIQARKPPPQHAHTCVPPAPCPLQFGCLVVNAPTANTVAAAEHGIALMTALARNVAQADASMKAGKWERNKYVGVSMVDKVLAIMGFGKVRRQAPAVGRLQRRLQAGGTVQHPAKGG